MTKLNSKKIAKALGTTRVVKVKKNGSFLGSLAIAREQLLLANFRWLPHKELVGVLFMADRANRLIGGAFESSTESLILMCGNTDMVRVPISIFKPSGDGIHPNFSKLYFTDFGTTVGLGDYEAAADTIFDDIRKLKKTK